MGFYPNYEDIDNAKARVFYEDFTKDELEFKYFDTYIKGKEFYDELPDKKGWVIEAELPVSCTLEYPPTSSMMWWRV